MTGALGPMVTLDDMANIDRGPLFVSATAEEAAHLPQDARVLVTGIGTINCAVKLCRAIEGHRPSRLINLGTAGALRDGLSGVFEISSVLQHDFSGELIAQMTGKPFPNEVGLDTATDLPTARLATGDAFISDSEVRDRLGERADLVDMEGYAVARVGRSYGIPVTLLKQVSDSADESAKRTWFDAVDRGARELATVVGKLEMV